MLVIFYLIASLIWLYCGLTFFRLRKTDLALATKWAEIGSTWEQLGNKEVADSCNKVSIARRKTAKITLVVTGCAFMMSVLMAIMAISYL